VRHRLPCSVRFGVQRRASARRKYRNIVAEINQSKDCTVIAYKIAGSPARFEVYESAFFAAMRDEASEQMIGKAVDFALHNRFLVLAAAVLLFGWGAICFHQLRVEALPDVTNNYVEVTTLWPGIAAELIEQQVTIPLEIAMNGNPNS
jgi:hypothetical protein